MTVRNTTVVRLSYLRLDCSHIRSIRESAARSIFALSVKRRRFRYSDRQHRKISSMTVRHVADVIASFDEVSFDDVTALGRCLVRSVFLLATTLALLHPVTSESHRRSDVTATRSRPEVVSMSTRIPALMASESCRIVSLSRRRPNASLAFISPMSTRSTINS